MVWKASNSHFSHVAGLVIYSYDSSDEDTDEEGDEVEGVVDDSDSELTEVSSTNQSKHILDTYMINVENMSYDFIEI